MTDRYDSRGAWRTAALLLVFMMANFFDKIVVGLLAVPIMNELKLTPAQFGVIGSSFFWLFAVGGIAGGFIANRVATRWLLLVMAVAWSLCQIPLILSSSLAMFVVARVALGLTEGPAYPTAVHAVYKWFPPNKRILPVALFGTGAGLGLLVAGMLVPLVTQRWGWRTNFVVLCAFTLLWAVAWLAFGREGKLDDTPSQAMARRPIPYGRLLGDPSVFAAISMQFVSYWGIAMAFTWLPAYFQKGLGCDAVTSGRLYAVTIAAQIPLALATAFLVQKLLARGTSSRIARGWFTAGCQVLAGVMFICLMIPDLSLVTREIMITIGSALGAISYAICPAILGEIAPPSQRSAVLALSTSIASIAGIVSPFLTGRLIQANVGAHGYELGFFMGGAMLIVGSVIGATFVNPERSIRRQAAVTAALD
ncbi:MFS transporter [Paraburkholderia sp. Tr-20389]|uniref:MFS transporter n=1 Tax=Paraburkholderia sp. Tr-20389 TaxID=2703903 RepID=UPI00197D35A9|nr:MFS transporter [Paraburkholderia sp. Tr-20389]MBN3755629.1 MFS transporter [Paraburkholderia sp. Tr-20389]